MRSIGVYLHIPFCVQKCAYCDFLSGPATKQRQKEYVESLLREIAWESKYYTEYKIQTIFFGGGTPSILEAEEIAKILDCVREYYQIDAKAEVTLEMNPGTAEWDKLLKLKKAGINRLSIGLQSADNAELKMLGRIHTYEDFQRTYYQAREAGFANINIDLMSALPGQHMDRWIQTLEKVLVLRPEHLSAYSLIIEEGTRLYENRDAWASVPDEDEDRQMYQETKRILAKHGYHRYEISNYAQIGYECRHNKIYWQRGVWHTADFVGFGLGASSTVGNWRWENTVDMEWYLSVFQKQKIKQYDSRLTDSYSGKVCVKEAVTTLSFEQQMEEFMFLGLRMMEGISKREFADSFGVNIDDVYKNELQKWLQMGMMVQKGDMVMLTNAGIDVSNTVLSSFILV
ncbi:oxygen-independent coproporphyrinogen-III oxidase-like protein YqeR [Lachnospiraceae bacterium]|nr:oxygen-independent coproporphyrinogen-III oxidase-like protein YqeR [Lachnospiraceae bacterium]